MIEFRWLDAPLMIHEGAFPEGMTLTIPRKLILQYRHFNGEWNISEGVCRYHGEESEWKDVPTVKYEDLRQPQNGERKP